MGEDGGHGVREGTVAVGRRGEMGEEGGMVYAKAQYLQMEYRGWQWVRCGAWKMNCRNIRAGAAGAAGASGAQCRRSERQRAAAESSSSYLVRKQLAWATFIPRRSRVLRGAANSFLEENTTAEATKTVMKTVMCTALLYYTALLLPKLYPWRRRRQYL
jgi:hypothetical protein